jgi:hypothetical protein
MKISKSVYIYTDHRSFYDHLRTIVFSKLEEAYFPNAFIAILNTSLSLINVY